MMAPRRVIEDSDEDDDGFVATEMLIPSMTTEEAAAIAMMQPSSTDPVLFRAVYEEHFGKLMVDEHPDNQVQSPVFEDPILDQRMSSSGSVPSARKLNRSKTVNVSSLSPITESTLSNRKAKCVELMRDADDLTQITSPRKSKDETRKDPWEVPTSSAYDRASDLEAGVKSRNSERNVKLKTYGRQIRRTQTVAHTIRSASTSQRSSSPLEDEMLGMMNQNRAPQARDVDYPPIPRRKRPKIEHSENFDLLESVPKETHHNIREEAFPVSSNIPSIGVESISTQVQQSTSEHANVGTNQRGEAHAHDTGPLPFTAQADLVATVEDPYLLLKSYSDLASRKSPSSIVVIPDALNEDQKLQYEIVSVPSTIRSPQSSLPEMLETINPNTQRTGVSDMVSIGIPSAELPPGMFEDGEPAILPTSSPPIPATNRKRKRAKSDVDTKRMQASAATSLNKKSVKRKGRSKTIAHGEKQSCREASVDELSLTSLDSIGNTRPSDASTKTRRKRAHTEDQEKFMSADELHPLQGTDKQEQLYQFHPSPRRSKSISTNVSKDDADLRNSKARVVRKKSLKAIDAHNHVAVTDMQLSTETLNQASIIQDASATANFFSEKDITQQTENPIPRRMEHVNDTIQIPPDVSVVQTENVQADPAQPKKRSRKKISAGDVSKTPSADSVTATPKDDIIGQRTALLEMDSNRQSSQEMASTPPTKVSIAAVPGIPPPAQTPTKDSKKGPDQHSPLQSGKVPYRVGLSKKTRIAPLLKIIRK